MCGGYGELRCPANTKRGDAGAGYGTLAQGLRACQTTHEVPHSLSIPDVMMESSSVEELLLDNYAKFHYITLPRGRLWAAYNLPGYNLGGGIFSDFTPVAPDICHRGCDIQCSKLSK